MTPRRKAIKIQSPIKTEVREKECQSSSTILKTEPHCNYQANQRQQFELQGLSGSISSKLWNFITKALNVWNKKRARSEKVLQNSLFRVVCVVQNHHSWVLKRVKEKFNRFLQRHMNSVRNPLAFQSCQDNFPYRLFLHYKYVTVCSPDQRFNRLMAFKTPLSYLTR